MRAAMFMLALAACHGNESSPRGGSGSGSGVAVTSNAGPVAMDAAPPEDLKAHMRQHFAAISELQRAIARGHLDQAKELATWLSTHDEPSQEGWKVYVDELHAAAAEVRSAPDLPSAAALAARLGRACSKCHEARDATVTFAWEPAPAEGPALAAQMKRHQWAAARLWDGLVGPAEQLWQEGATALASMQLDTGQAAGSGRGDVAALAARVRELAKRATTITDLDARAKLYGELLSTCAGCHQIVRPAPVPGP